MLVLAAGSLHAQHSYTASDVEDGARVYQANCSVCHGPEGDLVPGVNFSQGQFLSVKTDEDLQRVMLNGIPGTPMPAATFPSFMAFPTMAYVRSMSEPGQRTLPDGDASRGKLVFEGKGDCLNCHRVGTHGSRLGPDLSDIGGLRRAVQLERALLDAADLLRPNIGRYASPQRMARNTRAGFSISTPSRCSCSIPANACDRSQNLTCGHTR